MENDRGQRAESVIRELGLSEQKHRLLDLRVHGIAIREETDDLRPRPEGSSVPLSAEQRLVWFHASQQSDLAIYNEPITIIRQGSFDLQILEASLNEVIRRHEAWRTSFSRKGEGIVHDDVHVTLPFLDLSHLTSSESEVEALRVASANARQPLSLADVPLFRACLIRMTAHEHRLYLTLHHIVFDGISIFRILMPELSAIYAAFEEGKPSPLPDPVLQYGDYACWRERKLISPTAKQHMAYWLKQLSGELPVLRLPFDRPRAAIVSHRGSMECFEIPAELTKNLRELCRKLNVTLYTMLLAAFEVLLFRYSGQNDLIIGSATDSRRHPKLEGMMGFFLNTIAIRTRPLAEAPFAHYLAETRDTVLKAFTTADVPFDRVVQQVNPRRESSHHPIFQAFFSMRPASPRLPAGWDLMPTEVTVGATKFDLYLEMGERNDVIDARFHYSTELFDPSTIERMVGHLSVLLQSICRNPDATLGSLSILTAKETRSLLGSADWNNTAHVFPQVTLQTLIRNQVHRQPHATAVVFGDQRWTYAELSARADVIAAWLRAVGVTQGSTVAIALDRSLDLLAGLIAVLRLGAAYLPLDILLPPKRIAICLADAKPSALLTQRSLLAKFPQGGPATVLVDGNHEPLAASYQTFETSGDLDDTAYVIYTSGTTGEPKAVEISQRSLVNLLASMQVAPGFGPEDTFLALTAISFDIATLELFQPLVCGGTVVIASREEAQDPDLLAKAIKRSRCTVMLATPATWRTLLLSGWNDARQCLPDGTSRMLRAISTGESLTGELADSLIASGAELWNMYGPTETTIWSTIYQVSLGDQKQPARVSVGRPIANTQAYILDPQQQLVPVGVSGELFLGGLGLAKGYRGRPQQTKERFFTVDAVGEKRLYRTGDLAVRRTDGTIEVLGRTDNQVKVRGYRVELEAVEAAVQQHPHVSAAAACVWPDATGNMSLSVYVVGSGSLPPNLSEIRAFLSDSVPEYMIPSRLVTISKLPLTSNGKLDRSRLPEPTPNDVPVLQKTKPSAREARLAAIWKRLLGLPQVALDDNFFDLGGHSILVAHLQHSIAAEFGQHIPMAELFHSPTVRQQAELTQLKGSRRVLPSGVLALQPNGAGETIFWVHFGNQRLAKAIGDDQPFLSVVLIAEDIMSLGEAPTLKAIAKRIVNKILATQPAGPYRIGGLCVGGVLAYEVASILRATGHEVSLLILVDAENPSFVKPTKPPSKVETAMRYLRGRGKKGALKASFVKHRQHLVSRFGRLTGRVSQKSEMRQAQEIVEAAALAYRPERYDGPVLLLIAADRPAYTNLLAGWQKVIPDSLRTVHLDVHHDDLMKAPEVLAVGKAISSNLTLMTAARSQMAASSTDLISRRETRSIAGNLLLDDQALSVAGGDSHS